jgi:mono/diheme cytochrome c family protein
MNAKLFLATLLLGLVATPTLGQSIEPGDIAKGAQYWAQNCTRCHTARLSAERTDRAWKTITAHMRTRANLTKTQARVITAYLMATNLPEQVLITRTVMPTRNEEPEKPEETTEKPSKKEGGTGG